MKKVAIITLGCKTNQYENQALGEMLEQQGFEVEFVLCKADFYILGTCAVTNEAERKSRQFVSKLVRLNPKCKIFVCGCASQNNPAQFKDLPNVQYVTGNAGKQTILEKITARKGGKVARLPNQYEDLHICKPVNARAYVKIQDGCNRFCSYCLIPYLRGRSRSRSIMSVLQEVDRLVHAGASEIVLTGIDISDYKIDDTPALLELLSQIDTYGVRFRLSSFEPNILTDEFVARLAKLKNFCPHFHISMQSGCNQTLERMNRHYTAEFFLSRLKLLRKAFKNPAITTDVIVGFPGETDAEFASTLQTIKKAKFAEIHAFPYSRRSGTAADKLLENKTLTAVNGNVIKARMQTLLALAQKLKTKYLKAQRGCVLQAVMEEISDDVMVGTTQNYVKVFVKPTCQNILGTVQNVKIMKPFQDGVWAVLVQKP